MKHEMNMINMFRIPAFEFKFKEHETYKQYLIDNIEKDGLIQKPKNTFKITGPNLHKKKVFDPLRIFFLESLYQVLRECNLNVDIGITSMWATKHEKNDFHHTHTHGNSFFVGVYYLDSDSEEPSGTEFQNVIADFYSFHRIKYPSNNTELSTSFNYSHIVPFEPGKLIIFPGWLRHTTPKNKGENRYIVGFNTMPIGLTNTDHYDRYNYADFRDGYLIGDDDYD